MKRIIHAISFGTLFLLHFNLYGQSSENCFLNDFSVKTAQIPPSVSADKPVEPATVVVTIEGDTIGKVSKYVFGNAIAAWAGAHDNPTFVQGVTILAPTPIRFPGGSWSDGYFWNGVPTDVPDSVYDGQTYNSTTKTATKNKFWGQTGAGGWQTTPDQWYALRDAVGSEGLITVNYGYARYGTSDDPVGQAAHHAAEWVRYDFGRTKFWEIGNENGGPWEYGWMIDTALNKDGQPEIITGELYGKHFKVFADSMRAAAAEGGNEIYIGGQIIHVDGTDSWNVPDRTWNEGFLKEVGDYADFYVMHNYYSSSINPRDILAWASTEPKKNIDFIKQDILNKSAYPKPVAVTEYNIGSGSSVRGTSYINGMQAVVLISEFIKNNYGLAARWLLISGSDGLFYGGSDANYSNHPHTDFYYLYYLPKFYGDHAITTTSSNGDILCYASRYSSGETAVIIVNKNTIQQVVNIDTKTLGIGQKYYVYSFTGGTDNSGWSQNVTINGYGPGTNHWGPFNDLATLPTDSYPIESAIKITSPGRSIQMIMIEGGNNILAVDDKADSGTPLSYDLSQNYPNPFNPTTKISFSIKEAGFVKLNVYNLLGQHISTLVDENLNSGTYERTFNASGLPSGLYLYKLEAGNTVLINKMLLLK